MALHSVTHFDLAKYVYELGSNFESTSIQEYLALHIVTNLLYRSVLVMIASDYKFIDMHFRMIDLLCPQSKEFKFELENIIN